MAEHKLTDEQALDLLHDEVEWLEETIAAVDRDVANAIQAHVDGIGFSKDIISRIQQEYQVKHDLMFKAGRASVHIEQLEERIEQQRARAVEEQRQADTLAVLENHLDWLEVDMRRASDHPEEAERQEPERDRR